MILPRGLRFSLKGSCEFACLCLVFVCLSVCLLCFVIVVVAVGVVVVKHPTRPQDSNCSVSNPRYDAASAQVPPSQQDETQDKKVRP